MAATGQSSLLERSRQAGAACFTLLADLVFPRRCGVCGRFGPFLCAPCRDGLPVLGAAPAEPVPHIDELVAACSFDGAARLLVHRLKYERLSALAEPMAEVMATAWQAAAPHRSAVHLVYVPVPLHPRRERERGFNQSALLARCLARRTGAAVQPTALTRIRATAPQARQSMAEARAANVAGAFQARESVAGWDVVLVDDVTTTGATLAACAEPLRAAGVRSVRAVAFARA